MNAFKLVHFIYLQKIRNINYPGFVKYKKFLLQLSAQEIDYLNSEGLINYKDIYGLAQNSSSEEVLTLLANKCNRMVALCILTNKYATSNIINKIYLKYADNNSTDYLCEFEKDFIDNILKHPNCPALLKVFC
jgi:hypothetical protein